jgi:hypothetical protein
MLRLTSEGTYYVLKNILIDRNFTQKELIQQTGLSKGRVSQIISWLVDKGFLIKSGRAFELLSHREMFRLFQLMRETSPFFKIRVGIQDIEELFKDLEGQGIVLCESSALCFYDLYCVHKELDCYVPAENMGNAVKILKKLPRGDFLVKLYVSDLPLEKDTNYIGSQRITGEVRTVIDLYTFGKAAEAEALIRKIWPMD